MLNESTNKGQLYFFYWRTFNFIVSINGQVIIFLVHSWHLVKKFCCGIFIFIFFWGGGVNLPKALEN